MKHVALEQLKAVAEVHPDQFRPVLTRPERLERWAELLERDPGRHLRTLPGTEYAPTRERDTMRRFGSPISVAFADPVLRAAGLEDDSYGEAKRFFEMSDRQLHEIVCYCHFGATVTGAAAAGCIRAAMRGPRLGIFTWLRQAFAH